MQTHKRLNRVNQRLRGIPQPDTVFKLCILSSRGADLSCGLRMEVLRSFRSLDHIYGLITLSPLIQIRRMLGNLFYLRCPQSTRFFGTHHGHTLKLTSFTVIVVFSLWGHVILLKYKVKKQFFGGSVKPFAIFFLKI